VGWQKDREGLATCLAAYHARPEIDTRRGYRRAADPVSLFRWALFLKKRVRFHFVDQPAFERLANLGRHKKISPLSVCNMNHLFGKVLSLLRPLFANPRFS
jgi:hypothetical protein